MTASTPLPLVKVHALGNDFLLTRLTANGFGLTEEPGALASAVSRQPSAASLSDLARRACDRHRGNGADGLMFLQDTPAGADTRLFNADGGEAEVSGNGVRCAAAWLAQARGLSIGSSLVIGTVAGPKTLELLATEGRRSTFRADMGPPADVRRESLEVLGQMIDLVVLRVGNPQCVVLGPATEDRLHTIAAALSVHPFFPEGTNVELAAIEAPGQIRILIWERGVGPTEASGTGACAAAVAAMVGGGAPHRVDVVSPGGTQQVVWEADTLWLTGWAEIIGVAELWLD